MGNFGNLISLGYVPTPPRVVELIATYVSSESLWHAVDPCCGSGEAIKQLVDLVGNGRPFGIELDVMRSRKATRLFPDVLACGYQETRLANDSVDLLFLNPPYAQDLQGETGNRLELSFLRNTMNWIRPGGLLVYIIRKTHVSAYVARRLSTHFGNIQMYRFPDPEFEDFQQVVIFGTRLDAPEKTDAGALELLTQAKGQLDPLPVATASYILPERLENTPWKFRLKKVEPEEIQTAALHAGVWATAEFREIFEYDGLGKIEPMLPLSVGHLAKMTAAGMVDNIQLELDSGPVLVKGKTVKTVRDISSEDDIEAKRERVVEEFNTSLGLTELREAGNVTVSFSAEDFVNFCLENSLGLMQSVQAAYPPLYDMTLSPEHERILGSIYPRKKLPGRATTGMLPVQQHIASAAYMSVKKHGSASLIMATGTGKTVTALGVARLFQAERMDRRFITVVLTEEHLPEKWKREVQDAIPGAMVSIARTTAEVDKFFSTSKGLGKGFHVLVLPKSMAKLGSGWTGAYKIRHNGGKPLCACPRCGSFIMNLDDKDAITFVHPDDDDYFHKRKRQCPECQEHLWQQVRVKKGKPFIPSDNALFGVRSKPPPVRYPLAAYIRRRYRWQVDLVVIDEAHRYNAQSTDQVYAYKQLVGSARIGVVELTASTFNGRASSLFTRLHRLNPAIRRRFAWTDRQAFVARYGRLEKVVQTDKREDDGYGRTTGYRRRKIGVKELPGVSPSIVPAIIHNHAFLSLEDLGAALPPYTEICVPLEPNSSIASSLADFDKKCLADMKQYPRIAGAWLQATLSWSNTPWNEEEVFAKYFDEYGVLLEDALGNPQGHVVATLKPEMDRESDVLLPKEEWLLRQLDERVCANSGVGVYLQHVHGRGLVERLTHIIRDAGYSVAYISDSVSSRRREAWLKTQVGKGLQVLLTHPAKVETGLDLYAFPSLVFFQIPYNLTTVLQAKGRAFRLGQMSDCYTMFPYYTDTMEHRALTLMSKKVAADTALTGREVSAEMLGSENDRSFMQQLIDEATSGSQLETLGTLLHKVQQGVWEDIDEVSDMFDRDQPLAKVGPSVQLSLF